MKKRGLWLPILISLFLWALILRCFASDIDIPEEPQATINANKINMIRILPVTKTVEIDISIGYLVGDNLVTVRERKFVFMDVTDNPLTPENETKTDYTDFMTAASVNNAAVRAFIRERW